MDYIGQWIKLVDGLLMSLSVLLSMLLFVIDVEARFTLFIKHFELWYSLFDVVWMLIFDVVKNIFLGLFLSFFHILCPQRIPFHVLLVHVEFGYHQNIRNGVF